MIIKEFLPIKGCNGYFINEQGIILSNNDGTVLKQIRPQLIASGYYSVRIFTNEGIRKHFLVHRLVAETFLPNPNSLTDVNHIDSDKTNNNLSNLEWCSRSDNLKHFYKENTRTKNTKCKLLVNNEVVGTFDSIRKACLYVNDNYEPCNVTSMSNHLRNGVKPYRGKYTIERI